MDFGEYLEELADGSRRLKVSALQRLSQLNPEQSGLLAAAWPKLDVRRRRRVVQELIDLAEDNVELNFDAVFRRGLDDEDADVRLASVRGLWESESPALIDEYARLLEHDSDARVRAEAALSLGRFVVLSEEGKLRARHFERVEAALRRSVEDGGEIEEVRARALEAIGAYDAPWVRQAIREAYESGDHRMKVSAVHAMGRSCEPRWLPLVTKELSSDEAELRYEAAVSAGTIGDESSVESLLPRLLDEDAEVRDAAAAALGEIGGSRAREALSIMLDSEDKATREAAEAALAKIDFEQDPLGFRFRG